MDDAGRHDDSVSRCQGVMHAVQDDIDAPLQCRYQCIEWSRVLTQLLPLVKCEQRNGSRWTVDQRLADNCPRLDYNEIDSRAGLP